MKAEIGSNKWHKRYRRQMLKGRGQAWCLVYGLADPRSREIIRYVGQTRNTRQRFEYLLRAAKGGDTSPLHKWVRQLLSEGIRPKLVVIDQDATWDVSEVLCIDRLRRAGMPLLNVLQGGSDKPKPRNRRAVIPHVEARKPAQLSVSGALQFWEV